MSNNVYLYTGYVVNTLLGPWPSLSQSSQQTHHTAWYSVVYPNMPIEGFPIANHSPTSSTLPGVKTGVLGKDAATRRQGRRCEILGIRLRARPNQPEPNATHHQDHERKRNQGPVRLARYPRPLLDGLAKHVAESHR